MAPRAQTPAWLALARPLLAFSYLSLSHAATLRQSGALAATGIVVIVVLLLMDRLWQRRMGAWVVLFAAMAAGAWLSTSPWIFVPLLLMPFIFLMLMAWLFGRTLLVGRVPVITKIVSAIEQVPPEQLEPPRLRTYTRGLTQVWVAVFVILALTNLLMATLAVPGGLLARAGIASPMPITNAQWSWFANWLNYGLVGVVFVIEYIVRSRVFPGRYSSPLHFARRIAQVDRGLWARLFD